MSKRVVAASKGSRSSFAGAPKRGLVIRSAEGTRMKGLGRIPAAKRESAVAAFLKDAK